MNQNQAVREQFQDRALLPGVIENAIDCLGAANAPAQRSEPLSVSARSDNTRRNICGWLLAAGGDTELPVQGALVQIHAVTPLKKVVHTLPSAVLAHCRTLLLEPVKPVDLYHASKHVADEPLLSFTDVQRLRDIPGYELLAAAARSQADATLKRLLCSNPTIARLLLCYYHPASFSTVAVASVLTDAAGHFQHNLSEPANAEDRPGYIFSARRKISSDLYATLYKPTPAIWHTHWGWPAGKAVTLRTSHPLTLQR